MTKPDQVSSEFLSNGEAATSATAALFAGLFVVGVFLQRAKNAALLNAQIEALHGAVDAFIRLDDNLVHSRNS